MLTPSDRETLCARNIQEPRNADAVRRSHVKRAGIQFITSSVRAPHQPNRRYLAFLYPTIESMVLTTLNKSSPGSPHTVYQKTGLTKPSVRFSLRLSMAALRHAAASSFDVSRPTNFDIAVRVPWIIVARRGMLHLPSVMKEIAKGQKAVNQEHLEGEGGGMGKDHDQSGYTPNPQHSQKQEQQNPARISVHPQLPQGLFDPRQTPAHQTYGMRRVVRVAKQQVENDARSEQPGIRAKVYDCHLVDQPSANARSKSRTGSLSVSCMRSFSHRNGLADRLAAMQAACWRSDSWLVLAGSVPYRTRSSTAANAKAAAATRGS